MNISAIRQTVALAERITPPDLDAHSREVSWALAQMNHTKSLLKDLFGIEAEARQKLECSFHNAECHHSLLTEEGEQLQKLGRLGGQYQRLSLEPLTWRDAKGFPRLVIFTLNSPIFRLVVMPDNDFNVEPRLPEKIVKHYEDVLRLLTTKRKKRKGLELTCRFEGLIPCEARKKIKKARGTFGDQIFIIAEPGSFVLNATTPLPKGDPLIVGYDPKADADGLWLIADFETTPVEEAMIFLPPGK